MFGLWLIYIHRKGVSEENPKKIKLRNTTANVYLNIYIYIYMCIQVIETVFWFLCTHACYVHVHTGQIPQMYLYAHVHTF